MQEDYFLKAQMKTVYPEYPGEIIKFLKIGWVKSGDTRWVKSVVIMLIIKDYLFLTSK